MKTILVPSYLIALSFFLLACNPIFSNSIDSCIYLSQFPNLEMYVDSTGAIQEANQIEKWQKYTIQQVTEHNSQHAYWFHFTLNNESNSVKEYQLKTSVFDSLNLLTIYGQDTILQHRGLLIRYNRKDKLSFRELTNDKYSFKIVLPSNSEKEFYLRVKNVIRFESEFKNITLEVTSHSSPINTIWFFVFHALLFSILLFVAIFTLAQFLQNRDAAYGYYVIYLLITFLYFWWKFEKANSIFNVLFTTYPEWYYYIEIPLSISIYITYLFFIIHFINAKKEVPFFYLFLRYVTMGLLIYILMDRVILYTLGYAFSWEIYYAFRVFFIGIGIYAFIIVLRSKVELAIYLLSGSIVVLLGSAYTGYLSKMMSQHYIGAWDIPLLPIQIATLIEIFCFSIGLGYKSQLAEKEKMTILQSLALEQQEKEHEKERKEQLTQWFSQISHEIRTPLTIISGISNNIKGNLDEATLIQHNCQRLLGLVNQVLSLQKLENDKVEINWSRNDIMDYLRYVGKSFDYLAATKNQTLQIHCSPTHFQMDFDKEIMCQVVGNLLSNAIKYSPERREVSLMVTIEEKQILCIKVKDNGLGIPREYHKTIFQPYNQLPNNREGTGIGLALVKENVSLLGGQIELKSIVGKGSSFIVQFPIQNRENNQICREKNTKDLTNRPQIISPQEYNTDKPVLLVIDDHLDIIRYLKQLLQLEFNLITAINGQEGLKKAKQIRPDLIIADLMMPTMDGYELTRQLKSSNITKAIPIVLLTANATKEAQLKAIQLGVDAFLTKPFNEQELVLRIQQLLQKRSVSQEIPDFLELPSTKYPIEREAIQFMQTLHQVIEENLTKEHFKIKDVCTILNINHTSLNEKIKRITGQTTGKYIRHYRLSTAKQLLETTDLSTTEIAWKVGISEVSNFSVMFKKVYGVSPRAWRKGNM